MIPASTTLSLLASHPVCAGLELAAWNVSSVNVRRGYLYFRKEWQARRDEIVME